MAIISSKPADHSNHRPAAEESAVDALLDVLQEAQQELPLDSAIAKGGRRSQKKKQEETTIAPEDKTNSELLKGDRIVEETQKQDEKIRPQTIQEYVGQKDLKDVLDIAIRAAKGRGEENPAATALQRRHAGRRDAECMAVRQGRGAA